MILKIHLDTGEVHQVSIKRAHVKGGVLLYQLTVPTHFANDSGVVDLSRTTLVEFDVSDL